MQIFLSYASEDRALAEEIQLALLGSGHAVFFDKASLPAGGDYHARIEAAVRQSDLFIFLISPNSVAQGSYALTELRFARSKWPHPKERLLPVRLHGTPWEAIPPYLKSVTVLEPEGSAPAEVVAAVTALCTSNSGFASSNRPKEGQGSSNNSDSRRKKAPKIHIWVATFGLFCVSGAALLAIWLNDFPANVNMTVKQAVTNGASRMKEPDAGIDHSPPWNAECPEITVMDYSKSPPESKIVRRCPP